MSNQTKKMTASAVLLALSVVLPLAFHLFGWPGLVLLPMHLPVLLAGVMVGARFGALVGILAPILNFLITGRPPMSPPILPMMVLELGAYGLIAGLATNKLRGNTILALIAAMVGGRVVLAVAAWIMVLVAGFKAQPIPYVLSSVSTGLPGILIQIVLIPILVAALKSSSLRPSEATPGR